MNEKLKADFRNLIETTEYICLSTINADGVPETRAMMSMANKEAFPALQKYFNDSFTAYYSTATSTDKVSQLASNNKASVYYYTNGFVGLLLMGKLEIVTDKKIKDEFWQDNWTMYYPTGINDPEYTLLKFTPSSYKYFGAEIGHYQSGNI